MLGQHSYNIGTLYEITLRLQKTKNKKGDDRL